MEQGSIAGIQKSRRIASLDGMRALSIGLVLFAHLLGTQNFLPEDVSKKYLDFGRLGVRVFFVISGYLITSLLLAERERTGRISLGSFYIRRALRILPAFYSFIGVVALLKLLHVISVPAINLVYASTYTLNLVARPVSVWTIHLWSLAVEEQFYLLWPAVVALCSLRKSKLVAMLAISVPPLLRVLVLTGHLPLLEGPNDAFPLVADELAFGCLGALFAPAFDKPRWRKILAGPLVYIVPPLILLASALETRTRVFPPVLYTLLVLPAISAGITFCVIRFTRYYGDAGGRLLNSRPIKLVGLLSYSIYLWQQFFLNIGARTIFQTFPVNLICALVAGVISFWGIERPFLSLKKHFERRPARVGPPVKPRTISVVASGPR